MINSVLVPIIIAAVAVPKRWTCVTAATAPFVMRIMCLAIHVVSLAVKVVDMNVIAAIPVINATGRLVQIAHQCSSVLMSNQQGVSVERSFVMAVRQTKHVPTAATSTVTSTSIWYLATFAVIHVAMTVESSEL